MRRLRNYTITQIETPGYHNAPSYLRFKTREGNHLHMIKAGRSDHIALYHDKGWVSVLSYNRGLGYVGLEIHDKHGSLTGEAREDNTCFFQGYEQSNEILGEGWEKMSDAWIIRCLQEYVGL